VELPSGLTSIGWYAFEFSEDLVLRVKAGSKAEGYAKECEFLFGISFTTF